MARGGAETHRLPFDTGATFEEKLTAPQKTRDALLPNLQAIAALVRGADRGLVLGVLCVLASFPEERRAAQDALHAAEATFRMPKELTALDVAKVSLGLLTDIPRRIDPDGVDMPPELANLYQRLLSGEGPDAGSEVERAELVDELARAALFDQ